MMSLIMLGIRCTEECTIRLLITSCIAPRTVYFNQGSFSLDFIIVE